MHVYVMHAGKMMFQVLLRFLCEVGWSKQYFGNEFSSSDMDSNNLKCNQDF